MIGSAAHFTFMDFITHSMPVVFVAWIATLFTLRVVYGKEFKKAPDESSIRELMDMDERKAIKDPVTLKKILIVL